MIERSRLLELYGESRRMALAQIRDRILRYDRCDLFCELVLGYQVTDFHLGLLQHQFRYHDNLQIAPRGSGKSTICTVGRTIFDLIKNPNLRICIASRIRPQSIMRLREIRSHFETNSLLIEMFGPQANPRGLWNATEIEVLPRTSTDATPSIMCVGATGSIAGAHFDISREDDLIDKTNSATETTRVEFLEWYNATYEPMFDPATPDVPQRGTHDRVGTRYHPLDAYGTWIKQSEEAKRLGEKHMAINVVPALTLVDGQEISFWPERWNVEELRSRRRKIGRIAFDFQYQGITTGAQGELFNWDDFIEIAEDDVPKGLKKYLGVDLAISEKRRADNFAMVVIGVDGRGDEACYYILDYFQAKITSMPDQVSQIVKMANKHKVLRIGVDSQGYQRAVATEVKKKLPHIPVKKILAGKAGTDKVSRGQGIQPIVESRRVFLPCRVESQVLREDGSVALAEPHCWPVRENLVLFPNGEHDDLFDAFEYAIQASRGNGLVQSEESRNLEIA